MSSKDQLSLKLDEFTLEVNDKDTKFSDFIVYVDESGDHNLTQIDSAYPIFVLAFCIFYKDHYANKVVPKLQQLKFEYFGHDLVILHEHEIRKEKGDFNIFKGKEEQQKFMGKLGYIIDNSNFVLASCVIEKRRITNPEDSENAYHIALRYCMESLYDLLREKGQQEKITHVVVEERGKREDADLELAFRRVCDGDNKHRVHYPFSLRMANKKANSAGLQLADLVARPIGKHVIDPIEKNRAFDVLKGKFFCKGGRKRVGEEYYEWGLKRFPTR